MYKYILFDLDGTLTDPGIGITNSVMHALEKFGIEVKDRSELYPFIGPPLTASFKKFYGFDDEKANLALTYYREYFSVTGLFENEIYDGIPEALSKLKQAGYTLSLATSKPDEFSIKILKHFNIYKYFDFIGAATMDEKRNTKSAVIQYVIDSLNVTDMSEMLMIGDRFYDIEGAKSFGMDSMGVTFGYGTRKELEDAGATFIVDSVEEIVNALLK